MPWVCNSLLHSIWVYKTGVGGRSSYLLLQEWTQLKSKNAHTKHTIPSWPEAESLPMCFSSITCSTDSCYSKCLQSKWRSTSSDGKQRGAELSLQPNTCKLVFGAQTRNKILGTLAQTFTYFPWVLTQILAVLPLSQARLGLMQRFWHSLSPAVRGSLITCYHLSGLYLHLPSEWTLTWQTAQAI